MIYIDYIGGAHGNYLEFICNKFLAGVDCNELPFNAIGSSHDKGYQTEKKFQAWHYFEYHGVKTELYDSKIVSIQIDYDDLLPLASISLLRAGDRNIDNRQLEIDTYHKLNNIDYKWVLENIINSFFQTQVKDSYDAVKDSSWPDIYSIDDFNLLPEWIRAECINLHHLKLFRLDSDHPDCPRHILREFFKLGFQHPEQAGFITQQQKMVYDSSNDTMIFPFSSFYNTNEFVNQIQLIAQHTGYTLENIQQLVELHQEFLTRQPYKDSKKFCDTLITRICNNEFFNLPDLDLMQESYISAKLEIHYNKALPVDQEEWFTNSKQILKIIK
jgi:hypothetical protein